MEIIIKTEKITKIFNKGRRNETTALQDVSIEISQNSAVLLRGPSGSGKTTLLTLLSALAKPTAGNIICLNQNLSHWPEKKLTGFRRRHMGIIFQKFNLINNLSVFDNIAVPLIPQPLSVRHIQRKVKEISTLAQIDHRLNFKAGNLSGGEQQRVAIARALVQDPEILIADEPTAHLDSRLSSEILTIFSDLKKRGKTIIIATHDPVLNGHPLIDKMFCIKDGRLEPSHVC